MTGGDDVSANARIPFALRAFCLALMMPAGAINGAFIALAIPALAPYGISALVVAAIAGAILGILPARWLAQKIHDGLNE